MKTETSTTHFRKVLLTLCIIIFCLPILTSCSSLNTNSKAEIEEFQNTINKAQNSKIIVLDVYHNRCESCKEIEPTIEKLKEEYSTNNSVVFLKYDLSNPFTLFKSRRIAKPLGIEEIYKSQRFSGVVLIIDPKSKQVLETIIAEPNIDKYRQIIEARLANA